MPYRLREQDPDPSSVRELTLIPFRQDGICVVVETPTGALTVPHGVVKPGESWLLDSTLRIPLMTAGFRTQRVHPFAIDHLPGGGLHLYAWIDGDRYSGRREHVVAAWREAPAEQVAQWLEERDQSDLATVVRDAGHSFASQDDASYYADNLRLLEPAYLRGTTVEAGSGAGGTPEQWRLGRQMIVGAIDRDGTFLDVGCANGLLMESVHEWARERGFVIEPYGVDLGPRLVALAQKRLPHWADRIAVGNAIDWVPPSGRRFTFVHLLEDCVPTRRRRDLVEHALAHLVEPGGRLLVSRYRTAAGPGAAALLRELGYRPAGEAVPAQGFQSTAWIDAAEGGVPGPASGLW